MKIDFHSHYYPPAYIKALESRTEYPTVRSDEKGVKRFIYDEKRFTVLNDSFYDIKQRIISMDKGGVDMAVLTLSNPFVLSLYKLVNDEMSLIMKEFPERFACFAVLPYNDIAESVEELDRAVKDLGLKGLMLPTSIDGEYVDSPKFLPIFKKAEKLGIPVLMHPVMNQNESMKKFMLETTVGFPLETTLTAAKLILEGVLDKLPNLKIVLSHAGGALPYLIGRIDQAYESFDLKSNAPKTPSKYLDQIYIDTICFRNDTLAFASQVMGSDHLVFGTDEPFAWRSLPDFVDFINKSPLTPQEKGKIFNKNAERILRIA